MRSRHPDAVEESSPYFTNRRVLKRDDPSDYLRHVSRPECEGFQPRPYVTPAGLPCREQGFPRERNGDCYYPTIGTEHTLNILPASRHPVVDLDSVAILRASETADQHVPLSACQPVSARWDRPDAELEALERKLTHIELNRSVSAAKCEQFLGYLEDQQRRYLAASVEETLTHVEETHTRVEDHQAHTQSSSRRRLVRKPSSVFEHPRGVPSSVLERSGDVPPGPASSTCDTESATRGRGRSGHRGLVGYSDGSMKESRAGWALRHEDLTLSGQLCPDLTSTEASSSTMLENDWSYYFSDHPKSSPSRHRKSLSADSPGSRSQRTPRGRHRRSSLDSRPNKAPWGLDAEHMDDLCTVSLCNGIQSPGQMLPGNWGVPQREEWGDSSSESDEGFVTVQVTITKKSGHSKRQTVQYAGHLSRFSPSQIVPLEKSSAPLYAY